MKIVSKQPAYVWVWDEYPHFLGQRFGQQGSYKWERCSQWMHAEKFETAKEAKARLKFLLMHPKLRTFKKTELRQLKLVKISGIQLMITKEF